MKTIQYALQDGVATLLFDEPNSAVNTMCQQWKDDLTAVVQQILADRAQLKGLVLASAKSTFFAGADLKGTMRLQANDAPQVFKDIEQVKKNFRTLGTMGIPVFTCLNGTALGGGWELAVSRDVLGFGSGVRIDGVSAGKYWGNFFARWRHQQVKSDSSSGSGDRLFVRYYYEGDADHYVEANVSRGRSDDFSSALIQSSRSDSRGLVWYHFVTRDWGFKLSASESNDSSGSGSKARDLGIGLTRRW